MCNDAAGSKAKGCSAFFVGSAAKVSTMAGKYMYMRGNQPASIIELTEDNQVKFNHGAPHGSWQMRGGPIIATMMIQFHSQADLTKMFWHQFDRIANTSSWRLLDWRSTDWCVVMVPFDGFNSSSDHDGASLKRSRMDIEG